MSSLLRAALIVGGALLLAQPLAAEELTLEAAIGLAVEASPALQARQEGISAARAGQTQAGARPNPVLSVEAENFAGTGPYDVFSQPELTVTYEQEIERGGKRDARLAYADRDVDLAEAQRRVARLNLAQEVQRAYIDVQIAGEQVWLASRRLETERELQQEALRRVRGYRDPLFVETRTEARVAQAELALAEAEARQSAAVERLASYWGGDPGGIEVADRMERSNPRRSGLAQADADLSTSLIDRARAGVIIEQAYGVQNYSLSGGARYLRESNDVAFVAGVSIPLGRFDRNEGNIARAQAERRRMELEAEADRLARLRRLADLRAEAEAARIRADGIMQDVYPSAARTLEQVREGYDRGGFRFSDLEDAADVIIEAQEQWVEAMIRYRDAQSEIDRLTGRFEPVSQAETTS